MSPSQKAMALRIAMSIPFGFALLILVGAILGGKAIAFAIGWVIMQLIGYGVIVKRYGIDPSQPILASQIAIHWLMMVMLIAILVRAA